MKFDQIVVVQNKNYTNWKLIGNKIVCLMFIFLVFIVSGFLKLIFPSWLFRTIAWYCPAFLFHYVLVLNILQFLIAKLQLQLCRTILLNTIYFRPSIYPPFYEPPYTSLFIHSFCFINKTKIKVTNQQ